MFIVEGQKRLHGSIRVSGSKNAALPILCAALLTKDEVTLHNVPDISDVHSLLTIFNSMGVKTTFQDHTVTINAANLTNQTSDEKLIKKMRASILLFGAVLPRLGELDLPFPGGCVLGKRSVFAHTHAFEQLGAKVLESETRIHIKLDELQGEQILMPEMSVTASENAIMMAVLAPGKTRLKLVAAEPHVQDLCNFLNKMGAKIYGIGTHFLEIEGVSELHGAEHAITGDYLEAGTFAVAGLITDGHLRVEGIETEQLDAFWQKLDEMEANYTLEPNAFEVHESQNLKAIRQLRTAVYPSFATDLQAPATVLLTQAEGESHVFETMFEGRLNYLLELEKMGAKVELLNPHQARLQGPVNLKGTPIASLDIRAGAAMVLAALAAEGTTEISNIVYIDRGYENLDLKLQALGASIQRVEDHT